MDPENLSPLEELKRLDQQVDLVPDLAGLKPIFYRLEEVAKANPNDFEVQLVVADIKQHLVNRGMKLKEMGGQTTPNPLPTGGGIPVPPAEAKPLPASGQFPQPPGSPSGQFGQPAKTSGKPSPGLAPHETPSGTLITPSAMPVGGAPPALNWKRALWIGAVGGAAIAILGIATVVQLARTKNADATDVPPGTVPVEITTTPTGASIRINNEPRCTSDCKLNLAPGNYQITAFLDGYDPAASGVTVAEGSPISVPLKLEAQPASVRLLTDLDQGKVYIDDRPPADLQDGQFIADRMAPGRHRVRVAGKDRQAEFQFELAPARAPVVIGAPAATNLAAIVVASFANSARVVTHTPASVMLDGQAQGQAGPGGLDLKGFSSGVHELIVGEGADRRNMKESFGPGPMLTAFLKTDLNIGTLIVSTADVNGVSVFLNEREYRLKTQRGQLRIPWLGHVNVRVAKDGFQPVPPQSATVAKGAEMRLEFGLKPLPQTASLQLRGATPGTQVLLDSRPLGVVGSDGSLSAANVPLGDHTIELRREQFSPRRLPRTFRAGETVTLSGGDVVLASGTGIVRLVRSPGDSTISYRRSDESQAQEARGNQLDLPPGTYVFTARAPGHVDRTERIQVAAGETRNLDIQLQREAAARAPTAPTVKTFTMADWEQHWTEQGDVWTKRGGGFVSFRALPVRGTFTFTVHALRGWGAFARRRIRWHVDYADERNNLRFELSNREFFAFDLANGREADRDKAEHGIRDPKTFTLQIDITPERVVHRMLKNGNWEVIDSFAAPAGRNFSDGKFGFLIRGDEEVGLSDFKFAPR